MRKDLCIELHVVNQPAYKRVLMVISKPSDESTMTYEFPLVGGLLRPDDLLDIQARVLTVLENWALFWMGIQPSLLEAVPPEALTGTLESD